MKGDLKDKLSSEENRNLNNFSKIEKFGWNLGIRRGSELKHRNRYFEEEWKIKTEILCKKETLEKFYSWNNFFTEN